MQRQKILIVDDSSINRFLLKGILRKENLELLEATNGDQALDQIHRHHPAMVLLDVMMPAKDGFQVCAEIQADAKTKHIPVLFLSAKAQLEDKVRGLELGAVDYITKPFNNREVLARVRSQMTIQRLNHAVKEKQKSIEEGLKAAAQIQNSFIPERFPHRGGLSGAWYFSPCETVSGDIFNVIPIDKDHTAVYMLDVSGHGVSSAMVAVSVTQQLSGENGKALKRKGAAGKAKLLPTHDVVSQLNKQFAFERFEKFLTMFYLLIDHNTGRIRYCNAGHPAPLVMNASGQISQLKSGGPLVGVDASFHFEEGKAQLGNGDSLILYTDGIIEQENALGKPYGEKQFQKILASTVGQLPNRACQTVMQDVEKHVDGHPFQDDISLLILNFKPEKSK